MTLWFTLFFYWLSNLRPNAVLLQLGSARVVSRKQQRCSFLFFHADAEKGNIVPLARHPSGIISVTVTSFLIVDIRVTFY